MKLIVRVAKIGGPYWVTFLLVCYCSTAYCCSSFCLTDDGHVVCGRNMDFDVGGGVIVVNPKGVAKTALLARRPESKNNPAQWTSRYGSVTFSLSCRELPCSGINERGLVVNEMTLEESVYPERDSRPEVVPLQWIQYQLDNCATVNEVLATDKVIRVARWEAAPRGHHFFVSDSTGTSATLEFVGGKLVVHSRNSLPVKALTNNTYDFSIRYLKEHRGFGGGKEIELGPLSRNRFVCLADVLQRYSSIPQPVNRINYAFESLSYVSSGQRTVWSIVYDVTAGKIHYRTHVNPNLRVIDVKALDFSRTRVLSIENDYVGPVNARFVNYTTDLNRRCLTNFVRELTGQDQISDEQKAQLESISRYPETFSCVPESDREEQDGTRH